MDLLLHFAEHALEDTLGLVPFLFVTYLALEALEHAASARSNAIVHRAGAAGPVAGALLGVVPQCGFSAMAATLYAGRVVTLGTLVAVFFSTSDEMLPMLVAERIDAGLLFKILGLKVLIALITGVAADLVIRALRQNTRVHESLRRTVLSVRRDGVQTDVVDQMAEGGEDAGHICRLCEQDHCGCGHKHHHAGEHDHGSGVARASHVGEHAGDVRGRELDSEHDHVHEGHGHEHSHGHDHDREHGHAHDHDHAHGAPGGHHHRGPAEIAQIIDGAAMTDGAKAIAHRMFGFVADAEARAHGVPVGEVHFHEVGAVDSIADIIAIAVAADDLAPDGVVVSDLPCGYGTVRCQHGLIPVPAPATAFIAEAAGLTLSPVDVEGELVTPTGAAAAAALRTEAALPERFSIKAIGMGAGKRAYDTPGILRAMIIEPAE